MRSKLTMLAVLVSTLWLSGCGQDDSTELRDWMESVKKETRLVVPKLSPPKTYMPVPYEVKADIDPFNPEKLMAVLARMKDNGGRLKPNMDRPREELESFPLDTLKMVGIIEKNGLKLALIQSDKKVYQAKLGGYIGQNFGLIVKISEAEVQIKETVQDAAGDWVEREAKLELQGSQK